MVKKTLPTFSPLTTPGAPARRRFFENRDGSFIVEFALIAAPLFFLVLGILETGYANFVQSRMDAAVRETSRLVMTGDVQNRTVAGKPLTAAQFRDQILCPRLPSAMKCADVFVNVKVFSPPAPGAASPYEQFVNKAKNGLIPPALDNTKNAYCVGQGKEYVVLQAVYPLPLLTTVFLQARPATYKGRPARLVQSTATFKNEPFPATAAAATKGC